MRLYPCYLKWVWKHRRCSLLILLLPPPPMRPLLVCSPMIMFLISFTLLGLLQMIKVCSDVPVLNEAIVSRSGKVILDV